MRTASTDSRARDFDPHGRRPLSRQKARSWPFHYVTAGFARRLVLAYGADLPSTAAGRYGTNQARAVRYGTRRSRDRINWRERTGWNPGCNGNVHKPVVMTRR